MAVRLTLGSLWLFVLLTFLAPPLFAWAVSWWAAQLRFLYDEARYMLTGKQRCLSCRSWTRDVFCPPCDERRRAGGADRDGVFARAVRGS